MFKRPSLLSTGTTGSRRRSRPSGLYKPIRVERVFAALAGVILLVVPLYLWRKPPGIDGGGTEPVAEAEASLVLNARQDAPEIPSPVRLGEVRTIGCGNGPRPRTSETRCDRLPFFEKALAEAIRNNADCAPPSTTEATVSFVLSIDFAREKLHLWPGRSGSLRRPQANELLRCVLRDIPEPDWSSLSPKHRSYELNVLATYPAS